MMMIQWWWWLLLNHICKSPNFGILKPNSLISLWSGNPVDILTQYVHPLRQHTKHISHTIYYPVDIISGIIPTYSCLISTITSFSCTAKCSFILGTCTYMHSPWFMSRRQHGIYCIVKYPEIQQLCNIHWSQNDVLSTLYSGGLTIVGWYDSKFFIRCKF